MGREAAPSTVDYRHVDKRMPCGCIVISAPGSEEIVTSDIANFLSLEGATIPVYRGFVFTVLLQSAAAQELEGHFVSTQHNKLQNCRDYTTGS